MNDEAAGVIVGISGPVVFSEVSKSASDLMMNEVIYVGEQYLVGEVTQISERRATIQVYENTIGLQIGDPIFRTGQLLSATLGPGLLGSLYDGLQRPLEVIRGEVGAYIVAGVKAPRLTIKDWFFQPRLKVNDVVRPGQILGVVDENEFVEHRILVPPGISGRVITIVEEGNYNIEDEVAKIMSIDGIHSLKMAHSWPVKRPRPYLRKLTPTEPLITGQRVLDTILPVGKGGTVAIVGGFGTGKTVLQNQFVKFLNVDIVVYVGCGERGNEVADLLQSIPKLKDIETGLPVAERTVIIANTSNMPVAAREASIYTGATIGEYYRDMGYDVALLVDSTTRWAEALREISSRQGEMPGEEGYPPYLASRLSEFYGRAGRVICLGGEERTGTLSIIASVSPPGGDFSEPVTQKTTQIVRALWALDPELAYRRHFPAVNISQSFTYYDELVEHSLREMMEADWREMREKALKLYNEKIELERVVRLVGTGALTDEEKLVLRDAELLEEAFLKQNALHPVDCYTPPSKQYKLLNLVITFHERCVEALKSGVPCRPILQSPLRSELEKLRSASRKEVDRDYLAMRARMIAHFARMLGTYR